MAHKLGQIVAAKCTKFKFKLVHTEKDTFERVNWRWRQVKEKRECVGPFTVTLSGHCSAHSIKLWHLNCEVLTILTVALLHFNRCNALINVVISRGVAHGPLTLLSCRSKTVTYSVMWQSDRQKMIDWVWQQCNSGQVVKGQSAEEKGGSRGDGNNFQ